MTDPAPEGIIMWHAAIEAAADRASRRSHLRQEHAAKIFQMDYPQAVIDSKTVSAKADEAASISDEIRSLPTPGDLRAALARAPEVQALVTAAVKRALETSLQDIRAAFVDALAALSRLAVVEAENTRLKRLVETLKTGWEIANRDRIKAEAALAAELLAQCDGAADLTDEDSTWLDDAPTRDELI